MLYADGPNELFNPNDLAAMSGLDFIRGILEGRLPAPPIGKTLGYQMHTVEEGRVCFRGAPTFDTCNPQGTVHGGWYGTLLDSAMTCAVQTRLPSGVALTTLEYKINILRAIPLDAEVECEGLAEHVGRSTGVARGEIRGVEDGRLYATGSTTCIVLSLPRG
ncbi:PaaI family thioesterase [Ruegeria sp. 2012CJ41-6]|uniref:PaaI family thioesterase n=1 Tax=Ruegeria spongiae TaxID=2942209 RepID=A0ABT0Q2D1_9RHOB|nr:PaaI family thioesterase [Ruegeria spongiae]MCL6284035.1 PaaI family thioesterase [Ruegeria spongiae]